MADFYKCVGDKNEAAKEWFALSTVSNIKKLIYIVQRVYREDGFRFFCTVIGEATDGCYIRINFNLTPV